MDKLHVRKHRSEVNHETAGPNAHTRANQILWHHAEKGGDGTYDLRDERIAMADEPDHDELCEKEQRHLLQAINYDLDLGSEMDDAVTSLRIVIAANESIASGQVVNL